MPSPGAAGEAANTNANNEYDNMPKIAYGNDLHYFSCQLAGNVSHKPGGRLPLLSARSAVTRATLKKAATNFTAW